MTPASVILLASAISLSDSSDNSDEKALRVIGLYCYKSYGIEKEVKDYTKEVLPEEFKMYSGLVTATYTVVVRKKIQFTWTF